MDAEQATPIEYANVVLYWTGGHKLSPTSRLVTGTVTDNKGAVCFAEVRPARFPGGAY